MKCGSDNVIYMDNNATTRIAPEVLEAMMPFLQDCYGNPSSMHTFGGQVGQAVKKARTQIAELIGADPEEIVFTSCGTESDSTAILSALQTVPEQRHVINTPPRH
ncbi:MAG: aminotransferase class V-fold PLP-dependent enzyme, partial [Candidatus Electrothrix sp. ATG1]|nr:aminotransferase class V-fold PLP-dependent enzyme [Candidatus Electrothrix sp. ATG1]